MITWSTEVIHDFRDAVLSVDVGSLSAAVDSTADNFMDKNRGASVGIIGQKVHLPAIFCWHSGFQKCRRTISS